MPCGKDEARRGTSAQNPFTCCQQHQACLRKGLKRFHAAAAQNETLPAPIIRSFALMQKRSFDIRRAMLLRAATRSLAKKLASRFDSLRSGFVRVVPGSISTLHSVRYQMLRDLSCGRLRHHSEESLLGRTLRPWKAYRNGIRVLSQAHISAPGAC